MNNSLNYWRGVRLFHVLLGALLVYAYYQHSQGNKLPESVFTLFLILGLSAIVYHSYRLAQTYGYL